MLRTKKTMTPVPHSVQRMESREVGGLEVLERRQPDTLASVLHSAMAASGCVLSSYMQCHGHIKSEPGLIPC